MNNLKDRIIEILKLNGRVTGTEIVKALDGKFYKSPSYVYGYLNALADNGIIKVHKISKTTFLFYL